MKRIVTILLMLVSVAAFAQKKLSKETKDFMRNNWYTFIRYKSNYTTRGFGLIENPKAIINSGLPYDLTDVIVKGVYYKKNGDILKIEFSPLLTIPANDMITVNFPTINRGTEFKVHIVSAKCKEIKLDYLCSECIDPY